MSETDSRFVQTLSVSGESILSGEDLDRLAENYGIIRTSGEDDGELAQRTYEQLVTAPFEAIFSKRIYNICA